MFLLHENFANQVLQALLGEDAPTAANLDEIMYPQSGRAAQAHGKRCWMGA